MSDRSDTPVADAGSAIVRRVLETNPELGGVDVERVVATVLAELGVRRTTRFRPLAVQAGAAGDEASAPAREADLIYNAVAAATQALEGALLGSGLTTPAGRTVYRARKAAAETVAVPDGSLPLHAVSLHEPETGDEGSADPLVQAFSEMREETLESAERAAVVAAGRWVRLLRTACGFTQQELAAQAGTTKAHISVIEKGTARNGPSVGLLGRIAFVARRHLEAEQDREDG